MHCARSQASACHHSLSTTGVLEISARNCALYKEPNKCLSSFSVHDWSIWQTFILQPTSQMLVWSEWSRFSSPAVRRYFLCHTLQMSLLAESSETGKRSRYGDSLWAARFGVRTQVGARDFLLSTPFQTSSGVPPSFLFSPYPTAFPYGNGMVLHFYQQQESSTTKTVHKVINKGLKTYV